MVLRQRVVPVQRQGQCQLIRRVDQLGLCLSCRPILPHNYCQLFGLKCLLSTEIIMCICFAGPYQGVFLSGVHRLPGLLHWVRLEVPSRDEEQDAGGDSGRDGPDELQQRK